MLTVGGGCLYKNEPGFNTWSWPRFELSIAHLHWQSNAHALVAVSLASLKRKESLCKDEQP